MIPYPSELSENEVQTKLYNLLIRNGLDARCQVMASDRKSLFDIVIYVNKSAILIIEVKKKRGKLGSGEQIHRYRQYGVKAIYCQGEDDIKSCVKVAFNKVRHVYKELNPV